jgi:arginyl-tRNA synthetase
MTKWQEIKTEIARHLNEILGSELVVASDLVLPPTTKMGHLAWPMFVAAKKLGQNPAELGARLLEAWSSPLASLSLAGPYLNFKLSTTWADNYWASEPLVALTGELVMVEYSNINTHKEYHLGHLRNISYGDAMAKIYQANGYQVLPVSYVNDFGIHVAKTLWAIKRGFMAISEEASQDKGRFLGQAYAKAVEQMEILPEAAAEVSLIMQNIESRLGEDYDLWVTTRQWSLDYFATIYQELQIKFAEYYYESEYLEAGKALVDRLLAKGVLKESQGAIIADLEAYDLGVLVIIRADGTALYPVADLALAQEKFQRHQLAKSFYVVDNRQALYFKQLFKILELMGYTAEMQHLAYDFIKLPTGMMSSRSGNAVSYNELFLAVYDKFKNEIADRHVDWQAEQISETAQTLTVATLKFEMLKVGADKVITFDLAEALRFDGFTATYLEYAAVRINSIIKKSGLEASAFVAEAGSLIETLELDLLAKLAQAEDRVLLAGETANPSEIAKYLYELAQLFNDYYSQVQILSAGAPIKLARLKLLFNIREKMQQGLALLGIEIVDQM